MINKAYKPSGTCTKNNPALFKYGANCKQFNGICTRKCSNCKNYKLPIDKLD